MAAIAVLNGVTSSRWRCCDMNFYKRHLGDYAKHAGHLSMLEHGAYTLLLDRYYTTERPIASRAEAYRCCRGWISIFMNAPEKKMPPKMARLSAAWRPGARTRQVARGRETEFVPAYRSEEHTSELQS